ncbi:MAG: glycosyltransferase family 39 protein, partial [Candidatus ainarchaeum sp.]|nr:glycosyltransferase family 39 protein [Candidatus ainarchaeum sp.]
ISSNAAVKILEKGLPIFDSGAFYSRALLFHYSQAISMIIFGVNDFGARFPSIIFGLLTVLLAFLFGKEFGGKKAGLMTALFCTIFFLEVFYSRQARFYQLFQLLFFATIFFSYKAKNNFKYYYFALTTFVLAIDTQIAGIILTPILLYPFLRKKNLSKKFLLKNKFFLLLLIPITYFLIGRFVNAINISTSTELFFNYIIGYFGFFSHMQFLLIFALIGLYYCFREKKELCFLLIVPTALLLLLVFFVDLFAFRYIYFITFPIIIFSTLMFYYLSKKYDSLIIIVFFIMIFLTSNLFNPFIYTNVLVPIQRNFNDFSAPEINYKNIPNELLLELKSEDSRIITLYSPHVEWYIKKPFRIIPFSMSGKGSNTINRYNPEIDKNVDVYSGQEFLEEKPVGEYYFIGDNFSMSKLKPFQIDFLDNILVNCEELFSNNSIVIKKCS